MIKADKAQTIASAPARAWLMGTVGWFLPGFGHLLQGKWMRALLLGGAVWACFLSGLLMGGHMFSAVPMIKALFQILGGLMGQRAGMLTGDQLVAALLQIPPTIANLGSGALYLVCWALGVGFADDAQHAARATYEYGNTFLLVAGLLNYLSMLDAFDISAGRKS